VVKFLHKALLEAWQRGASDLHFEPFEDCYRLRFRLDGVLCEQEAPPLATKDQLTSRIKVMANLDIAERRLPQDGGMKLMLTPLQGPPRAVDFRVSTLPTLFGEKVVIRILEGGLQRWTLDELGYAPAQEQALLAAIAKPQGMVLVTGPTGSGKTVSLYACLELLNQRALNISTVEDPCEIHLSGVNQVNVNERVGLTFAMALRALLRQDPDVLMVGEIRDLETADVALKAAQTGHLVLSTLHTNDAPGVITRLRHMGVLPFHIASSVSLVTAQRLLRRLCPLCKIPQTWSNKALLAAGMRARDLSGSVEPHVLCQPVGCPSCHQGYKGRLGVYQVMPMSEALQQIVLRDGHAIELASQAAQEGMLTLRQAAWAQALAGLTSLAEVLQTTPD
jgi:type IV pilus assembly protein PilB